MQHMSQRSPAMVTVPGDRALLSVSAPQFPRAKFPAGRRSSMPESPGGQPDSSSAAAGSSVAWLRWARGLDQRRLHLLVPAAVLLATVAGHALAVCGHPIPAEGLTLTSGGSRALCTACLAGTTREHTARTRPALPPFHEGVA